MDNGGRASGGTCIDWHPAFRAECLIALGAAFARAACLAMTLWGIEPEVGAFRQGLTAIHDNGRAGDVGRIVGRLAS